MSTTKRTRNSIAAAALAGALCAAPAAHAVLMVDATVTPVAGGFLYDLAVINDTLDDVSIVSIVDAPLADAIIGPSLSAPAGYDALYDGGLGFIDLLEDLFSFVAGTTVAPFSFQSAATPGSFGSFEALTVNGDLLLGDVAFTVLAQASEPTTLAAMALALLLVMLPALRRRLSIGVLAAAFATPLWAASHSDAPLIKQDPQANITDVYAFVGTGYDDPTQQVLNVIVQTRPFSEPGDGVIYDRFADDARYSIHLTDPATGEEKIRYDFSFSDVNPTVTPGLKNPNTILSYGLGSAFGPIQTVGGPRQNYTQTYSVTKVLANGLSSTLGTDLRVPPPNVGANTTPAYNDPVTGRAVSGANDFSELDEYTRQAIRELASGEAVFAGPREDGFYADIPAIFDLLDGRILATGGNGVDGFKGFNVLTYGLQIPLADVPSVPYVNGLFGPGVGIGVYASVSRPRLRLLRSNGDPVERGPFVQVNRMGNPVFNEAFVALADKDRYNRTSPKDDAANFGSYAFEPELARLISTAVGTSIVPFGRDDLAAIFIPDVLRVDTTTGPTRLAGQTGFSRLSLFGGDSLFNSEGIPVAGGWPNGRRLGDDVIDIALTALASGPSFQTIRRLGDNVDANDAIYNRVFPYAATPHAGTNNRKDPDTSSTVPLP